MTIALRGPLGRLLILTATAATMLVAPMAAEAAYVERQGTTLRITEDSTGVSANQVNDIRVTADDDYVYVTDEGGTNPTFGPGCENTGGGIPPSSTKTVRCARGDGAFDFNNIYVDVGDSADFVYLNHPTLNFIPKSEINGGPGVDNLNGLLVGEDTINGGDDGDNLFGYGGNDSLRGNAGGDSLYGGAGDDNLRGGAGADDFNGGDHGAGGDTVDYSADNSNGVGAEINGNGNSGAGCFGTSGAATCEGDIIRQDVENLTGTAGDDVLRGNDNPNVLTGNAGNDQLFGFGGADTLNGNDGDDRLQGGEDDDTIRGGDNTATDNGTGDLVDYTERETTPGDSLDNVTVNLNAGTGGRSGETDTITGVEHASTGGGDDTLIGTDNTTRGNILRGGAGDDFFRGLKGPDQFFGEAGTDTVSYQDDTPDDTNLSVTIGDGTGNDGGVEDGTNQGSRDTVHGDVENVTGGPDDDTLVGSSANNILDGAGGDDKLKGLAGADILIGGAGTDTVTYDDRTAAVVVTIDGLPNDGNAQDGPDAARDQVDLTVENLIGGSGDDELNGSSPSPGVSGNNRIDGAAGNDLLRGGLGADNFVGGSGEDIVDYSADGRTTGVNVTIGNNTADDGTGAPTPEGDNVQLDVEDIVGTNFNDTISGTAANNKLFGLAGSDALNGFAGNDLLDGGATEGDILQGGSGHDTLHGGSQGTATDGADVIDGGADGGTVTYALSTDDPRFAAWASKERTSGVTVILDNIANDGAAGEADSVNLVTNIIGGAGNDVLTGTTGAAGSAANVLDGRAGDDTLNGGAEPPAPAVPLSDTFIGGPGERDKVDYSTRGNDDDLIITLDDTKNDGEVDENDDIDGTIEDVTTAGGDDNVTGDPSNDNIIATNAGADTINTRDSNADTINCGPDADSLTADRRDTFSGCEQQDLPPQPLVSVSGPQSPVAEGSPATFTISIDDTTAQQVTVQYTTSPGTAIAGQDYEHRSGTATIQPGSTSTTIDVTTINDTLDEDSESFNFTISSPTSATLAPGGNTATATIADNDAQPSVSVGDAAVEEGDDGTKTLNIPFTLSTASSKDVTVKYSTGGGTATPGSDYTPVTEGTVVIPAGQLSANAPITIQGDTVDEANETFNVTATEATNATIADATGTGTITDNDDEPSLSISDASTSEGDSGTTTMSFTVTLSKASEKTVTVDYGTADGSANEPVDYLEKTGTLTFQPGTTTQTIDITVNGDTTPEADETFTVTLTNPSNAAIAAGKGTGTGTINDDDQPGISVSNATVTEGDTNAVFTVTLTESSGRPVTVDYTTSDGTAVAPSDYSETSGKLTFAPGETSKQVNVPVKEDAVDEPDETFTLNLSQPGAATIDDGTGTGTISDDDAPSMTVANASVAEGDSGTKDLAFTVTLSSASNTDVTVKYATANGTATAGSDYTATNGTLTIPAGQTTGQIKVPVGGDTVDEGDETLTLTLTEPEGATLADGEATGTITDDDGTPALSVAGGEVTEGNEGAKDLTFAVTLSGVSSSDVTVKYATADGSAKAGEDYTATTGTLTIKAGESSGEVKVPVTGDTAVEEIETFTLVLSEPVNATLAEGKDKATGIINNDDQAAVVVPALSVNDIKVAEGDTGTAPAVFTVSLSAPTTANVTVKYVTSDGTATSGKDYALAAGTLTFAAGERTKTVSVNVIGDRTDEPDETFALALVEPQGATLAKGSGAALITDDETPRVAPKRVTARTTPSRDRSLPYRFRTSGRVVLPAGVRKADGCAGKVQVRFKAGKKTISTRRVNLRKDCTFSRRVSFGIKSRLKPGRLKVEVRFLGNAVLLPKSAPKRYVRVVK